MTPIEIAAAMFGLLSVGLTVRESIWCWPTGLVSVLAYAAVFWQARLYSDAGLQVVYTVLCLYGWWAWLGGARRERLDIIRLDGRTMALAVSVTVLVSSAWGWFMSVATDAEAPFWDAFVVGSSLTAQFGLARKWLQSWWFWIAVDLMAIPLFASRSLHLTAILYGVFLAMAVVGALRWSRVGAARVAV